MSVYVCSSKSYKLSRQKTILPLLAVLQVSFIFGKILPPYFFVSSKCCVTRKENITRTCYKLKSQNTLDICILMLSFFSLVLFHGMLLMCQTPASAFKYTIIYFAKQSNENSNFWRCRQLGALTEASDGTASVGPAQVGTLAVDPHVNLKHLGRV